MKIRKFPPLHRLVLAASLPPLLGFLALGWLREASWSDLVGARTVWLFTVLVGIGLLLAVARTLWRREFGTALLWTGSLFLTAQLVVSSVLQFAGKTAIGAGEEMAGYVSVEAGPLARPPLLPLAVVQVDPTTTTCLLQSGRRTVPMTLGGSAIIDGSTVTLERIGYAPLFILTNNRGEELEGAYVKLLASSAEDNFFQFRVLPHRFYFMAPGGSQPSWKKEHDGSWTKRAGTPYGLNPREAGGAAKLLVMRGKMIVADQVVKRGEKIAFENHEVRFEEGSHWALLSIERKPGYQLAAVGGIALVLGMLLLARSAQKGNIGHEGGSRSE